MAEIDDVSSQLFYHGTKAELRLGDVIEPANPPDVDERDRMSTCLPDSQSGRSHLGVRTRGR